MKYLSAELLAEWHGLAIERRAFYVVGRRKSLHGRRDKNSRGAKERHTPDRRANRTMGYLGRRKLT